MLHRKYLHLFVFYFLCGLLVVSCNYRKDRWPRSVQERLPISRTGRSTTACAHVESANEQTVIALSKFYNSTQGQRYWQSKSNWLIGDPCVNEWYGVCCNNDGQITGLDLHSNYLNGSISELFTIKSLEVIDLSFNTYLNGSLPKQLAMPFLFSLNLTGNSLAGPTPTVWNTPKLKFLSLWGNYFNGSLPNVHKLKELEVLDVASNSFSGPLPSNYGHLSSLRELTLDQNSFKIPNKIPIEWLKLRNLEIFSGEMLGGKIPQSIGFKWPNMKDFQVLYGNLTGGLPRSICNWKNVKYLGVTNNPLGGQIPDCIGNLQQLKRIYLTATKVGGTLPESLGTLKNLEELDLIHNEIYGPIPSSFALLTPKLAFFEIFRNKLSSIDNSLEPLFKSKIMTHCDVSSNPFPCPLPDFTKSCLISSCSHCNTEKNRSSCSRCLRIESSHCGWCSEGPSCLESDENGNPAFFECEPSDWYNGENEHNCPA